MSGYCRSNYEKQHPKLKRLINEKKRRPCMDCQGWFEPIQMQFDHRDLNEKRISVNSHFCGSYKTLLNEMQKCDVVCANCHALRTQRQRDAGLLVPGVSIKRSNKD